MDKFINNTSTSFKSKEVSYLIPVNDLSVQTNVEDLTCIICLGICYKPVLITCCERLLCLECTKMMLKMSPNNLKCPYCNEQNIHFEKPSKLIVRLFENLTLYCPNKGKGCKESIKYHFYFDHLYNSCNYKAGNEGGFCKLCQKIYLINNTSDSHQCDVENSLEVDSNSEIERKLDEMYSNSPSSRNSSNNTNTLAKGTVYIPRLHVHNLSLTNERLNEGYQQGWLCELCNDNIRNPATKSYHCEQCIYDVCEKCCLYISIRKPNINSHKHELNLEIRDFEWECQVCCNYYYKRRSWYCDLCDFDVCVYCYWKQ